MKFKQWYSDIAKKQDYSPNQKDWEHYYDYEGAFNAGILAASIIGNFDTKVKSNLERWRRLQTQSIKKNLNNKCLTSL